MPRQNSDDSSQAIQRQQALSRWDNEGGAADPTVTPVADKKQIPTPEMSNADLVALHVRVIALENLLISLLATASDQQLELAREMAGYISPRPGFIPRPADCNSRVPNRISSGGQCSSERAAGRTGSDQRVVVLPIIRLPYMPQPT